MGNGYGFLCTDNKIASLQVGGETFAHNGIIIPVVPKPPAVLNTSAHGENKLCYTFDSLIIAPFLVHFQPVLG